MQQVLINTPATVEETWYEDGVAAAPGTVTVTVTRADGTVIVSDAPTTSVAAFSGDTDLLARAYSLPIAQTGQLEVLTLTWESATLGTLSSHVEVVGGFYFSVAEFKARYPDCDDESAAAIASARATAEEIIEGLDTEDGTHVAFVPRAEVFTLVGSDPLLIPRYHLRSVDALEIDGDVFDPDDFDLVVDGSHIVNGRWGGSRLAITVAHGLDRPPGRLKDAAMILAYNRLVNGPIDDRATGRLTPEGSVITLATPGLRGSITGIPEVDSAIAQYRKRRIRPTSVWASDPRVSTPGSWREGVWP